ncbi:MAG: PEP-CTERM sorting domain-containing protein [Chromatiales bacterium]
MKRTLFRALFGATLLASSLNAIASVIEVHYTGAVYETNDNGIPNVGGAGYNVGDSISGSLFIDTGLASTDHYPDITSFASYDNGVVEGGGFVNGYVAGGTTSSDSVSIEDDFDESIDMFSVTDGEYNRFYDDGAGNFSFTEDSLFINAVSWVLDFLHGDGLEQLEQGFDLLASMDADGIGYGSILQAFGSVENGVDFYDFSYAYFNLNSLSVRAIDNVAAVPEPSTIFLMSTGIVGLGIAGWKKKQA